MRSKSKNKSGMKEGKAIIANAIEEAKEKLKEYQQEAQAAKEMMGGEKGGKGKTSMGGMMGEEGNKSNAMSEFLGELGGSALVMAGGFMAGILQGMNDSANSFDFANRGGGFSVPKNLNSEEQEVYQNALIEAFGYTAFQLGDWKNWIAVEEYVSSGGFQDGDNGSSILGLLQDGEYFKVK